jgi:hypothetical protein
MLTQWLTDVVSVKLPAVLLLMIAALNANGQTATPAQAQCTQAGQQAVSATQRPLKFRDVTVTGSLRARGYAWDWFTPTSGNNDNQYPCGSPKPSWTFKQLILQIDDCRLDGIAYQPADRLV